MKLVFQDMIPCAHSRHESGTSYCSVGIAPIPGMYNFLSLFACDILPKVQTLTVCDSHGGMVEALRRHGQKPRMPRNSAALQLPAV